MSEATWLALTVVLTLLGATWTIASWRRRGAGSATRAAGFTALVPAAYLTGTLELLGDIAVDVGDWARGLAFSPVVWAGVVLAGLGAVLIVLSGFVKDRGGEAPRRRSVEPGSADVAGAPGAAAPQELPGQKRTSQQGRPAIDDDLADIEEILRRRGIS